MATNNIAYLGIYTGIIQGSLNTDVPMYNAGKFEFHITIGDHPCVLQKLKDIGMDDMYFQIRDLEPATVQPFDEFVDIPNNHIT